MPTYSYRCSNCGHEFERVQRISEDAIRECPQCGQPKAVRQITSGNFILKGSGWYSDAYSGGSNKKSGSTASAAPAADAASKPAGSSDAAATAPSTATPAAATPSTSTSAPSTSTGSGGGSSSGSSGGGSTP